MEDCKMRKQVPVPLKHIETPFTAIGRKVFDFHSSLIFIADTEANAQFIVKACNQAPALEAMKEALEDLVEEIATKIMPGSASLLLPTDVLVDANQALALAKKEVE